MNELAKKVVRAFYKPHASSTFHCVSPFLSCIKTNTGVWIVFSGFMDVLQLCWWPWALVLFDLRVYHSQKLVYAWSLSSSIQIEASAPAVLQSVL